MGAGGYRFGGPGVGSLARFRRQRGGGRLPDSAAVGDRSKGPTFHGERWYRGAARGSNGWIDALARFPHAPGGDPASYYPFGGRDRLDLRGRSGFAGTVPTLHDGPRDQPGDAPATGCWRCSFGPGGLVAASPGALLETQSALASEWFRRSEVRDLLFIASADIEWREAPNAPSRKWPLQKRVTALSLSPSGTAFIGSNWFDKTSVVGSDAGIRRAHAYPVRFIDDTRVLGIFHGSDRTELRMQELGEAWGEPRWHVSLPGLNGLEVDVVSPDGTWQVSAPWGETRKVLQGAIGDDAIKEEIWNANAGDGVTRIRTSPSGSGDLLVQSVGSPHRHPEHGGWDEPLPSTDPGHSTQLWLAGPAGRPERRLANTKFRCRVYATRTNRRLVLVPRLRSLGVLRLGDRTRAADSDTNDPWARGPDRGCRRCLRRFNDAGVPVGRPRPARRCSVSSLRPTVASIRRRRHGRGGAWRDRDCRSGTGDPLRLPASLGSLSGSL